MIEIVTTYDLRHGMDEAAYRAYVKRAVEAEVRAEGFLELRAHRSLGGSPEVRVTHVWRSLTDWARFVESAEGRALEAERRSFVTNIGLKMWGPSPILPEPVRSPG